MKGELSLREVYVPVNHLFSGCCFGVNENHSIIGLPRKEALQIVREQLSELQSHAEYDCWSDAAVKTYCRLKLIEKELNLLR